jgi:hypothetical protein
MVLKEGVGLGGTNICPPIMRKHKESYTDLIRDI